MYYAKLGRFIQYDSLSVDGITYKYVFAKSCPTNYTDPLGLWSISTIENGKPRKYGLAVSHQGDNIIGLANIIGLDADQYKLWLSRMDPDRGYPVQIDRPVGTLVALQSITQPIPAGIEFFFLTLIL